MVQLSVGRLMHSPASAVESRVIQAVVEGFGVDVGTFRVSICLL